MVLNALVSEGMMEVLLAIVEEYSSSSTESSTAESGLALMFLADLASGSETAKVRAVSTGPARSGRGAPGDALILRAILAKWCAFLCATKHVTSNS